MSLCLGLTSVISCDGADTCEARGPAPQPSGLIAAQETNLEDIHEAAWDSARVTADGCFVIVTYSAMPCEKLSEVKIVSDVQGTSLDLLLGYRPDGTGCPTVGVNYVAVHQLDSPLETDTAFNK